MTTEEKNLDVDVFWSMRSPYCYISLDRCLEWQEKYHLNLHLRICYPIALKDPSWFEAAKAMKYRLPYQNIDIFRVAQFHGVPMKYPVPDVVKQEADEASIYGKILPFEQQVDCLFLTHTAVGAAEMGKGWDYLNQVSRTVWNGQKVPWNDDDYKYIRDAIERAGIDADKLITDVNANPDRYHELVNSNMQLQLQCDGHHTGVPGFVFNQEPFFGQDRMDLLLWRLKQYGLKERADYQPTLRSQNEHFGSD